MFSVDFSTSASSSLLRHHVNDSCVSTALLQNCLFEFGFERVLGQNHTRRLLLVFISSLKQLNPSNHSIKAFSYLNSFLPRDCDRPRDLDLGLEEVDCRLSLS